MEQKDYLMRDVEKIGLIMAAIGGRIFGGKGSLAMSLEMQMNEAKDMLFHGANFDLDIFLDANAEESNAYLSRFNGFDADNLELLADYLYEVGLQNQSDKSKKYLEKALLLFELCNKHGKTYCREREAKIERIKNDL